MTKRDSQALRSFRSCSVCPRPMEPSLLSPRRGHARLRRMTPASKKLVTPLSEDDCATLDDFLGKHCRVDFDHLLGLLSAVAVAPGLVPPSAWLPAVLSNSPPKSVADARLGVGLLLRLFNEVLTALDERAVFVPEALCRTVGHEGLETGAPESDHNPESRRHDWGRALT